MEKTIYRIGVKQHILYIQPKSDYIIDCIIAFFKKKKHLRVRKEWIIKDVKSIYASSFDEALKKYTEHNYHTEGLNTKKWYDYSTDLFLWLNLQSNCFKLINEEYTMIDYNYNPTIDVLKKDLSASDFRAWWNDYHCHDIMEVLNSGENN